MSTALRDLRVFVMTCAGGLLFAAVQWWLFRSAEPIAGMEDPGWFLNTGRGVAVIAIAFTVGGAIDGMSRRDAASEIVSIIIGGVIAMGIILFSIGGGTIAPIVIAFGTAIVAGSTI